MTADITRALARHQYVRLASGEALPGLPGDHGFQFGSERARHVAAPPPGRGFWDSVPPDGGNVHGAEPSERRYHDDSKAAS